MADGGCDDVDDIHRVNQRVNGLETLHLHLGFHLSGCRIGRIIKADQIVFFYLFDAVDMDLAQMPCT